MYPAQGNGLLRAQISSKQRVDYPLTVDAFPPNTKPAPKLWFKPRDLLVSSAVPVYVSQRFFLEILMSKVDFYRSLVGQISGLTDGEPDLIANLSNVSALLNLSLDDLNWVGFYLLSNENELVLGPFQGKPACIRIPVGKGVCGTAVATGKTQRVADVHAFPGHIACDGASNSEIVLPVYSQGKIVAVLDIDSPLVNRFDEEDEVGLEQVVAALENFSWNR